MSGGKRAWDIAAFGSLDPEVGAVLYIQEAVDLSQIILDRAVRDVELTGDLYLIGNTFMQTWYFGKGVEGVEGWTVITVNTRGEVISLHGVVEDAATNPCKRQQEEEPTNPPPVVALNYTTPSSVAGRAGFDVVTASCCCLAAR